MSTCWNCGARGTSWPDVDNRAATRRICASCDVMWSVVPARHAELPAEVLHMGKAVLAIDFTRPGALSCPA